jgi:two-component system alkaline phosphatase synthesis response regulator PhoP/two-component system response regulator VicR
LEKAKSEKPDLIILDVMMPRMDGFEALQRLKTDPETSHIPVIMLTARAQDRDVLQGYQYGADLYLTKPFSPLELISLVKRVFESQEEETGTYRL